MRAYLQLSREPLTAVIAVLPLLVGYQLGILFTGGIRNGVDFVTDILFLAFGQSQVACLGFNAAVLVAFVAVAFLRRRGEIHGRLVPFVLIESGIHALLVGVVVDTLLQVTGIAHLLHASLAAGGEPPGPVTKIVMSGGAGLYEELMFRLVLMGGMFYALHRIGGASRVVAALVAVVVSSLIFSGVHHLGSMGEAFTLGAFVFRFFAGVVFAVLFRQPGPALAPAAEE